MYVYVAVIVSFIFYAIMTKIKIQDSGDSNTNDPTTPSETNTKWCNWSKYSPTLLKAVEKDILANLKTPYTGKYVNLGPIVGKEDDKIWTISLNEESKNVPLVMLHGMGSGVALWVMNLDELAADRPVYAIDVLGFGSSSRPTFSSDPKVVEMQMVNVLEEWRRVMKLDTFVLLGHSLGGFLSASYSIQHPLRVKHLVLADAWGLSESPEDIAAHYNIPGWARVVTYMLRPFNPLWAVRAAGPWGPSVIGRARKDIVAKFDKVLPNAQDLIPKYIHQCNSQNPTGESAFHVLMHQFAFAKNPMIRRMHRIDDNVPITVLFGSRSWIDRSVAEDIMKERPNSYVKIEIIQGSGHHINLDVPSDFNDNVKKVCQSVKNNAETKCGCNKDCKTST